MSTKNPQKPVKAEKKLPWYRQPMLLGIAVGGVVIVGLVVLIALLSRPGESFQVTRPIGQDFLPEMGDPSAPVTVYEYADYQCPACGYFAMRHRPKIEDDYIKTGKVRLVFKNFAFLGQESLWAAQAAYCAAEQGGFWAYHDKLFANQRGENLGAFSKANLVRFAQELGLRVEDFQRCLNSERYRQKVLDELREGEAMGITSTPSFIVNGQIVRGADYLGLRALIQRNFE